MILKLGVLQCPGSTGYLASLEAVMVDASIEVLHLASRTSGSSERVAALRDDPIEAHGYTYKVPTYSTRSRLPE